MNWISQLAERPLSPYYVGIYKLNLINSVNPSPKFHRGSKSTRLWRHFRPAHLYVVVVSNYSDLSKI